MQSQTPRLASLRRCRSWHIFLLLFLLILVHFNNHYSPLSRPVQRISATWTHTTTEPREEGLSKEKAIDLEFNKQCLYWKDAVINWKEKVQSVNNRPALEALQVRSGAGDRLSGLVTAVNHAMQRGKKLHVYWEGLDLAFETSNKTQEISGENLVQVFGSEVPQMEHRACQDGAFYACDYKIHQADRCPVYNRACMNLKGCEAVKELYGESMSLAHLFGCPLRLLLRPSKELLELKVSWFAEGGIVNGTVAELARYLRQFEVVSVHVRVGDQAFHGVSKYKIRSLFQDVRKCTNAVDSFVAKTVPSKAVRWFFASDNPTLRDWFREKFPSKVVVLMHNPQHLSSVSKMKAKDRARKELQKMFAEWYLLGRGDHLVVTAAHEEGRGVSSFARTAWLFTLRSQHYLVRDYDKSFCIKQEFQFEGNINVARGCKLPAPKIRQEHLKTTLQSNHK